MKKQKKYKGNKCTAMFKKDIPSTKQKIQRNKFKKASKKCSSKSRKGSYKKCMKRELKK